MSIQHYFKTGDVSRLTGVHDQTIHYWTKSGFITPSIEDPAGTGNHRIWSFRDVVAIRMAKHLRDQGVSLQGLRKVIEYLQTLEDLENPLAETWLVVGSNGDVYTRQSDSLVSLLKQPGQFTGGYLLHLKTIRDDVEELLELVS